MNVETIIKLANEGYAGAQRRLGDMYQYGKCVDINLVESIKWYKLAANQGEDRAEFSLGMAYLNEARVEEAS